MSMQCQLWMGSLEPNMTESFIMAAFHRMGQRPLAVKVMRNKFTGEPAGYAFVHFQTDEEAIDTMHKLNGKPIPGTFPVVRFRLNTASREARTNMQSEREFSVWVGDLSPDVDDYSLYRVFAGKYNSIKTAKELCTDDLATAFVNLKGWEGSRVLVCSAYLPGEVKNPVVDLLPVVDFARRHNAELLVGGDANAHHEAWGSSDTNERVILDGSGYTKGYGFVRFGNEDEQRNALYAMNGYTGLGSKPLKICTAVPKPKGAVTTQNAPNTTNTATYSSGTEYNHYYDPSAYWQNYSAWSGYYGQEQNAAPPQQPAVEAAHAHTQPPPAKPQNDELALVDHKRVIDVDQMNQEFLDPDLCLWDALESSQWFPHEVVEAH